MFFVINFVYIFFRYLSTLSDATENTKVICSTCSENMIYLTLREPKAIIFCQQYRASLACTSVQSDQAL